MDVKVFVSQEGSPLLHGSIKWSKLQRQEVDNLIYLLNGFGSWINDKGLCVFLIKRNANYVMIWVLFATLVPLFKGFLITETFFT